MVLTPFKAYRCDWPTHFYSNSSERKTSSSAEELVSRITWCGCHASRHDATAVERSAQGRCE